MVNSLILFFFYTSKFNYHDRLELLGDDLD